MPKFWPPVVSGAMWVTGFFFALDGVEVLGMGVGYVLGAVGPVILSGVVSTVYFKEVSGVGQLSLFWISIALQFASQVILVLMGNNGPMGPDSGHYGHK